MDSRPKTIFCDIDGTLIPHDGDICFQHTLKLSPLDGVLDRLREWDKRGYSIILVTGRRESTRHETEKQLSSIGIIYDKLIMGVSGGERVLINDMKPNTESPTATAINIKRNYGLKDVSI